LLLDTSGSMATRVSSRLRRVKCISSNIRPGIEKQGVDKVNEHLQGVAIKNEKRTVANGLRNRDFTSFRLKLLVTHTFYAKARLKQLIGSTKAANFYNYTFFIYERILVLMVL
jgi:hypothetical protein